MAGFRSKSDSFAAAVIRLEHPAFTGTPAQVEHHRAHLNTGLPISLEVGGVPVLF